MRICKSAGDHLGKYSQIAHQVGLDVKLVTFELRIYAIVNLTRAFFCKQCIKMAAKPKYLTSAGLCSIILIAGGSIDIDTGVLRSLSAVA